jgi:hypothetical protein
MHQPRALSIAPGTLVVAQPWADCITNTPESEQTRRNARRYTADRCNSARFDTQHACA